MASILIIDDEELIRRAFTRVIRQVNGVTDIIGAVNGKEGLERFMEDPSRFGLVLTDYEMPEMNGLDFLQAIQHYAHPPRVMVSGRADERLYQNIKSRGGTGLLAKPVDLSLLQDVARELLATGQSPTLTYYHIQERYY